MSLQEIVGRYPDKIARFLDISASTLLMTVDENHKVTACNARLVQETYLPKDPQGMPLSSILCSPSKQTPISLGQTQHSGDGEPQICQLCCSSAIFLCYSHKIDSGYLILGEKVESSENSVLETMTHLNNELSATSRKLSKKNRELQQANSEIVKLSRTDQLTGLANRRYFLERLEEAFSMSVRHKLQLSILIADMDHFKRINDTYGHSVGDETLRMFGAILTENCRNEDFPARYGGEEFIVMLQKTPISGAESLYHRLRESILKQCLTTSREPVTFSAGIAEYEPGDTQESLLKKADNALYEAKYKGRDRCVVYSS